MPRISKNQAVHFLLVSFSSLLIWSCAGSGGLDPIVSPTGTTTTFILVRHAEKANLTADSPLSDAGRERARALVDAVAEMEIDAIYCPAIRRNLETVAPLSKKLGLTVRTIPGWRLLNTRQFADDFIRECLAEHGGGVILWAGNSSAVGAWGSNLKELYLRLGGEGPGPRAYDDLFVMIVNDQGGLEIQKNRYGRPVN